MRQVVAALVVLGLLAGCSQTVVGQASPAVVAAPRTSADPTAPTTARQSRPDCLVGDRCDEDADVVAATAPDCSSLVAAVVAFEDMAFDGRARPSSTAAQRERVSGVVQRTVDTCGWQAAVDIAEQYDVTLYLEIVSDAYNALGDLVLLPEGLLCRDLQAVGRTAKEAVDYWSYWGGPDEMDADLDGVPCETVWPDAGRFLPAWA